MPNKIKHINLQSRIKDKDLNSNYNCQSCNEIVNSQYTTCPRCGNFKSDGKARIDWTPTKPPKTDKELKTH
jgi:lipopolysaccharide biosynthesis regulator YciM